MTAATTQPAPETAIEPAWRTAVHQGRLRNQQQRAIVLRYPDIAKRLTEPPARFTEPRQWSGFIPDYWLPEDKSGRLRPNASPVRAQLAEILMAACERHDAETKATAVGAATHTSTEDGTAAGDTQPTTQPSPAVDAALTPPWRTR
jgi:hypothetical protein